MAAEAIEQFKNCTKCGEAKPTAQFYPSKLGKYGVDSRCKVCRAAYSSARHKAVREEKAEFLAAKNKAWRLENPDIVLRLRQEYYARNRDIICARASESGKINRDRYRATKKAWRDRNREKVRESQRRARAKLTATPMGRLELAIKANVRNSLRGLGKGKRTFELLGYTLEQLMAHLEKNFSPGMSWENYGKSGWHVDHRVPLSAFNYDSAEHTDFKRAWALSNLQPLWEPDNHRKSNKLVEAFQPSLI